MSDLAIRRTDELPLPARRAVEALLGRPLADDEAVSVWASRPHDAPKGEERSAAWDELGRHLELMSSKAGDVDEIGQLADDLCDEVRHSHR